MFGFTAFETFGVVILSVLAIIVTDYCDEFIKKYYHGFKNLKDRNDLLESTLNVVEKENSELKNSIQNAEEVKKFFPKIPSDKNLADELQSLRIRCYMLEQEVVKTHEKFEPQNKEQNKHFIST